MTKARAGFETGELTARRTVKPARAAKPRRQPKRRGPAAYAVERRYRQTIRRVDLWSVLKVAVCFYLCALVVMLGAGIVLWIIAATAGVIDNVESFMSDLGFEDFEFLSWRILRASTLIGLLFVALSTIFTVLAAAFYNLFAELVGGIEVTVVEEDRAS
jgi:uncharacterized protein involved in cysteine biosynthesis